MIGAGCSVSKVVYGPLGGITPVVLDTASMGILFRWRAVEGVTVGTLTSEASSTPTTTPNGATAKTFTSGGAYQIIGDSTGLFGGPPIYGLCVASIPSGDDGEILNVGNKNYFKVASNVPQMQTAGSIRAAVGTVDAVNVWQGFIVNWNQASSNLTYDATTYSLSGTLGNPQTFGTVVNLVRNMTVSLAEVIFCTAPANFAAYAAYQYGVGNG